MKKNFSIKECRQQHGAQRDNIYWTSHGKHCARSQLSNFFHNRQQRRQLPCSRIPLSVRIANTVDVWDSTCNQRVVIVDPELPRAEPKRKPKRYCISGRWQNWCTKENIRMSYRIYIFVDKISHSRFGIKEVNTNRDLEVQCEKDSLRKFEKCQWRCDSNVICMFTTATISNAGVLVFSPFSFEIFLRSHSNSNRGGKGGFDDDIAINFVH